MFGCHISYWLSAAAGARAEPPENFRGVCDFYQTEIGASALVISPSIPEIRAGDPQTLISIAPSLTVLPFAQLRRYEYCETVTSEI